MRLPELMVVFVVLLAWVFVVWLLMRELCVSSIGRDDGLCLLLVDLGRSLVDWRCC
jgi:hypothetical protein